VASDNSSILWERATVVYEFIGFSASQIFAVTKPGLA
jgi:hypothetical protein